MIRLVDQTKHWEVPEWATYIECDGMRVEHVKLHDNVEFFYAKNNMLTELRVPVGIRCLDIQNNHVTRLTSDGPLTNLFSLDIRNNNMASFELCICLGKSCAKD